MTTIKMRKNLELQEKRQASGLQRSKDGFPIVYCIPRVNGPRGWQFYCKYCLCWHYHGFPLGHRSQHCNNRDSKYNAKGYILAESLIDE